MTGKIAVILGAGFSAAVGVPLARQLFDEEPIVDQLARQQLVGRVRRDWLAWSKRTKGTAEEYLAELEAGIAGSGLDSRYADAQHYVALAIAFRMGHVRMVGNRMQLVKAYIHRAADETHQAFWAILRPHEFSVVTTNYDILAERGLGLRPTRSKPGFHYGQGPVELEGGGYPSYSHVRPLVAEGDVSLLKLHGSVSWSVRSRLLTAYRDCRPALRGDAAILAPTTAKRIPGYLRHVWDAAQDALAAPTWVIVGHSLPAYDEAFLDLLRANGDGKVVHVLNPDPAAAQRTSQLLSKGTVIRHPGLPRGLKSLDAALNR